MTGKPLAVLIVEDSVSDTELIVRMLRKTGYEVTHERVETAAELAAALAHRTWDIVISDYRMPFFNAEHALKLVHDADPDLPFLIVSGSIGEEIAVAMMKAGAHDYLIKDNLARLAPAVERELAQADIRRRHRQAEEALEKERTFLNAMLDTIPDRIYFKDTSSRFIRANQALARLFGLSDLAHAIGKSDADFFSEEHARQALADEQEIIRTGQPLVDIEEKETWPDGSESWVSSTKIPLRNNEGRIIGTCGISRNITERMRTERLLRESEERYRLLVDQSPNAIAVHQDGKIVFVNKAAVRLMGAQNETDLIGKPVQDFVDPGQWEAVRDRIARILKDESPIYPVEYALIRLDGSKVSLELTAAPFSFKGRPAIQFIILDITERRRGDDALRASEERYRMLAENMSDTVWLMDMNLRILYISPSVTRQRGLTLNELNTMTMDQQMTPESLKRAMQLLAETLAPENLNRPDPILSRTIELEFYRKDGSTLWTENIFTLILGPDGKPANILGAARDITERKRAEEITQRQLNRLAALRTIDTAIRGSLDLRLTLAIVLRETIAQLGVDAARILLLNPLSQTLEYAAGSGFHTDALQHTRLRLGEGHAGMAALDQRVIHIPDLRSRKTDFLQLQHFTAEHFISYFAVPLVTKGQVIGVLEVFHRKEFSPEGGLTAWQDFLETIAEQTAIAAENSRLFGNLQQSNQELALAYDDTISGWSRAMDLHNQEAEGHTQRAADLTIWLAKAMGVRDDEILYIRRGALLHNIGNTCAHGSEIPGADENKGKDAETLHQHPLFAYKILSSIPYLHKASDIPYCHHEKWDGSGYPRSLKGEQIPLAARIFAVVNTWDNLTNIRPDRPAWSKERALDYIRSQSGKQFDPQVVEIFLKTIKG
jgi:PAS domain S-box-containing protein